MRTRQSICNQKARYSDEADALLAARRFALPLFPYRCERCGGFHLTSRTKGRRLPRPARSGEPL